MGSVLAQQIAERLNEKVLVVEKREHIGGNCYSETDAETGIEFHRYGSHIFHTASERVWQYIQRFSSFTNYRHRVFACVKNKVYSLPVNLDTINSFFNVNLKPDEVAAFLKTKTIPCAGKEPSNFEEQALSMVGEELYKTFFKGYTIKQWQIDPKELPASVFKRLPVRNNYDSSYFFDSHQGIPVNGYTAIFEKLLSHPNIDLLLNTDFFDIRNQLSPDAVIIYSGPIDRFFDYRFGKLQWRSLSFDAEVKNIKDYQGTSVMNYPDENIAYTRIHEPRHLHPERNYTTDKTLVIKEFSVADDGTNPYYPILSAENLEKSESYKKSAAADPNVIIAGRLGDYKYYDMDQTIERALQIFDERFNNPRA